MGKWIDNLPEEDRERVRALYHRARSFEDRLDILMRWHPKRHVTLKPIGNLETYFKYIRLTAIPSSWFRGEPREYEHLMPKLYRNVDDDIAQQLEKERKHVREFRRRARSLAPSVDPSDMWSWYFLIQHYGGPTRLLDWTQDAGMALFFALDAERGTDDNAIVTILQPIVLTDYAYRDMGDERPAVASVLYPGESPTQKWMTSIARENGESPTPIPNCPIPLLPPHADPRITAQRSCFTLFGQQRHGFTKNGKYIVCPTCDAHVVFKLVIDGKKKEDIRKELTRLGITSAKVYPGLEGLNKEISEEIFGE